MVYAPAHISPSKVFAFNAVYTILAPHDLNHIGGGHILKCAFHKVWIKSPRKA
jgi:hypothetical protein